MLQKRERSKRVETNFLQTNESSLSEEKVKCGFVGLLGPANAGKSTLLNSLLGKKVSIVTPKQHTTRNKILGIKNNQQSQIIFVDTPGFFRDENIKDGDFLKRSLQNVVQEAADDLDLRVLVLDALRCAFDDDEIERVLIQIKRYCKGSSPDFVLLNKVDKIEKGKLLPLISKVIDSFAAHQWPRPEVIPISALKGEGLVTLERLIVEKLGESPRLFPQDALSDKRDDFLISEIVREKLFLRVHDEIPYHLAVQTEKMEDVKGILHVACLIIVSRKSQLGIVIGKNGAVLKEVGTSARKEIEKRIGRKIFLKLHVKVESSWTESASSVSRVLTQIIN